MFTQSVWLLECKWMRFTEWKRKRELIVPNKFFFCCSDVLMFVLACVRIERIFVHVLDALCISRMLCYCRWLSTFYLRILFYSQCRFRFFFVLRVALRITAFTRLNHTFLCIEKWNLHEPMHFTKFNEYFHSFSL